jgi:ectoine hydroxylase-related dioxygenase (phytanoyl-CoA dioxygenase family)
MKLNYIIDGKIKKIEVPESQNFVFGENKILSNIDSDVTYKFDWYKKGFTIKKFITDNEFGEIKLGIEESIKNIISSTLNIDVSDFTIEGYHKYVKDDSAHFKIVSQTRDLFTKDFCFDINYLIPKLEKILGIDFTDYDEENNYKSHIIVRINRPNSSDFNPPHKDIYEHYDGEGYIPKFINFWIPICGVSKESVLPICPESHLISENKILRTNDGCIINDNKYRVRLIKNWDDKSELIKPEIKYGEVLIFSSHLIHGLSLNEQFDLTRVALEFRLYEKNKL